MAIKQGREYRALQDFSLVPREENSPEYRVRGTAIVFNTPTVLWECDGVEYKEIIDRHAFDECDMSDVIFNYNHGGKVVARLRNKTLALNIDPPIMTHLFRLGVFSRRSTRKSLRLWSKPGDGRNS